MLADLQYNFYTTKEIKPAGWLKKQLQLQAEGLAGNLHKVWPDIRDSQWAGGDREGWERMPYWLFGFIPMAHLLEDEELIKTADQYVQYIIDRQDENGWICPSDPSARSQYDLWAVLLISKVLLMYHDCTQSSRAMEALYRCLEHLNSFLDKTTLKNWGAARWFEVLIPLFRLYEIYREDWMLELAYKLEVQGFDWPATYARGLVEKINQRQGWDYITHVVNNAMMLKCRSLMSRLTGEDPDDFTEKALSHLLKHHGMACGHFTGDECLSGDSPVQGTELCGVVEAMYSYEHLFSVSGNLHWLDMLEKLAFNALPATISPDMWSHQYVQLTNQVSCTPLPEQGFRNNNEEAHLFGLEPHYGCCTANFAQGWPLLVLSAFMRASDGIAACLPVPAALHTELCGVAVSIELVTNYPFQNRLEYTIKAEKPVEFSFYIRIPGSSRSATVNGDAVSINTMHRITKKWQGEETVVVELEFPIYFETRPRGLKCLWRGPLLFALPIQEEWRRVEYTRDGVERKFPYCDYEISPKSKWNYGFASEEIVSFEEREFEFPFFSEAPPISLTLRMAEVPWEFINGRCAIVPDSNKAISPAVEMRLIPYGCTNLRMTEMPAAGSDGTSEKIPSHKTGAE